MRTREIFIATIATLLALNVLACKRSTTEPPPPPAIAPCEAPVGQWQSLGLESERVTAIALHPGDPRIIYAGTLADFSAGIPGKLFKSVDCGTTWDTLLIGGSYSDVELDPKNPETLYAIPGSLIKSTDGGKTWQTIMIPALEARVSKVAIDPKNPNILYAGQGGFFGGSFYKSTNGGGTWTNLWDSTIGDAGAISIAIDPQNTNIIFVGTQWSGSVLKSIDGGASWTSTGLGATGRLIHDVFIHPQTSSQILVGINGAGIFRSLDEGNSWTAYNQGIPDTLSGMRLAWSNTARSLYAVTTWGDDGWVYARGEADSFWHTIGIQDVRVSYYYSDLKVSTDGGTVYFGTRGIYRMRLL